MREAYQGRLKCACQKQAEESSDVEQNYLHVCNCPGLYVPASGYHTAQSIRYSIQFIPDTILKAPSQKFCSCKSISVQVYLPLTSILNLLTLAVPYTPRLGLSSSCQQSSNTTKPLLPSRSTTLASGLFAKQCSLLLPRWDQGKASGCPSNPLPVSVSFYDDSLFLRQWSFT